MLTLITFSFLQLINLDNKKKIFICCTEQSGENICFNILKLIEDKKYIIDGVCGHNSSKYIRNKFYDISLFKSIGFFEILFSLLTFIKILNNLCNIILKNNYDLIICIDSPDFNYNLVKKIRKKGFKNKIIQIVAPTVWAWRSGRSKKFSKIYDEIFTLFEFEKKFFEKHGLKSTFIGHPIFNINKINTKSKDKKYISFLPGSRENELNKLLPFYEHLYEYLYKNNLTNWEIFIPTLPHLKEKIVNLTNHWKINTHVMTENDKIESYYQKVYISVTCSGTATLEISKRLIPQIIIYKLNFFTVFLFSFFS